MNDTTRKIATASLACLLLACVWSCQPSGEFSPLTESTNRSELGAFCFRGKPIHPACLLQLSTDLADPLPTCVAVDLDGFFQNNRNSVPVTEHNGWQRIADKDLTG